MSKPGPKTRPAALRAISGGRPSPLAPKDPVEATPASVEALLNPPISLSPRQRTIWIATIADAPPGLICNIDRQNLISYVAAVETFERAEAEVRKELVVTTSKGNLIQSPYVGIMNKALEKITKLGELFGFDPSSRTRISVSGNKKAQNPFEEHDRARKRA